MRATGLPARRPRRRRGSRTSAAMRAAGAPRRRPSARMHRDHRRRSLRDARRGPPRSHYNECVTGKDDLVNARIAVAVQDDRDSHDLARAELARPGRPRQVDAAAELAAAVDEQDIEGLRLPAELTGRLELDRDLAALAMDDACAD